MKTFMTASYWLLHYSETLLGRHEKSRKPANLVCGHLYLKMWTFWENNALIVVSLRKSPHCVWIIKFSLEKPALYGQVDTLWSNPHSRPVDRSTVYSKVHIVYSKYAIFYALSCGHFPASKSGLRTILTFSHVCLFQLLTTKENLRLSTPQS